MLTSSFKKWVCATVLVTHVFEVGTTKLKAYLNALQQAGAHLLRGVCWHFAQALLNTETQLPGYRDCCGKQWAPHSPELNPLDYGAGCFGEHANTAPTATSLQ